MNFCNNCGAKVERSKIFCNNCGERVKQKNIKSNKGSDTTPHLSKRMRVTIVSLVALLLIGFVLYKVGDTHTSSTKKMDRFEKYLNEGNVKGLTDLLEPPSNSFKISEKNVKSLLTYLNENPEEKEAVLSQLRESVTPLSWRPNESDESIEQEKELIKIEKRGKKYLIYDNYVFVLNAFPLFIETNQEDVKFYVDGEEVKLSSMEDGLVNLGLYLPGEYTIKGEIPSDYADIQKDIKVAHFNKSYSDLYFDVFNILIRSNVEKASFLVDGKKTPVIQFEDQMATVGPVVIDGSSNIQLESETPYGKISSENVQIDEKELVLRADLSDNQKEAITEDILQQLLNFSKAINYRNGDFLSDHSTTSELIYKEFKRRVSSNVDYAGYLSGLSIDSDTFYLKEKEGDWEVEVVLQEKWQGKYSYSSDNDPLQEDNYTNIYTLKYESDQWGIENWRSYDTISDNIKDVEVDAEEQKKLFEASPVFQTKPTVVEKEPVTKEEPVSNNHSVDMNAFIQSFVSTYVKAINSRDFSIISGQIDSSSVDYINEVSNYIDHLAKKGMSEEVVRVVLNSTEATAENTYTISTIEEYNIYYKDGSVKNKTFQSTYKVVMTANGLKMNKLLKTQEIDS